MFDSDDYDSAKPHKLQYIYIYIQYVYIYVYMYICM